MNIKRVLTGFYFSFANIALSKILISDSDQPIEFISEFDMSHHVASESGPPPLLLNSEFEVLQILNFDSPHNLKSEVNSQQMSIPTGLSAL